MQQAITLGAGEVLVTSIDKEGTKKGFDNDLIKEVTQVSSVPIIASGGFGENSHLLEACAAGADGIAFADTLHFKKNSIHDLREILLRENIPTRQTL